MRVWIDDTGINIVWTLKRQEILGLFWVALAGPRYWQHALRILRRRMEITPAKPAPSSASSGLLQVRYYGKPGIGKSYALPSVGVLASTFMRGYHPEMANYWSKKDAFDAWCYWHRKNDTGEENE